MRRRRRRLKWVAPVVDIACMRFGRRWFGFAAMLSVPLLLLTMLRVVTRLDRRFFSAGSHLVVVSVIAGLALVIAAAAAVASRSSRHPGLVISGLARRASASSCLDTGSRPLESLGSRSTRGSDASRISRSRTYLQSDGDWRCIAQ